ESRRPSAAKDESAMDAIHARLAHTGRGRWKILPGRRQKRRMLQVWRGTFLALQIFWAKSEPSDPSS
ncbi:MAG TPA: hypothetical protein VF057_05685, partial [Thermoanaerobaculia bacterium]